ncbi:MAG: PAS domain S-box-containing protein [Desulforhopalus sp.]|jgi:PAS domain S-box-containing protein
MANSISKKDVEALHLFQNRNRLLTAIREQSLQDPEDQDRSLIFQHCCTILSDAFGCHYVWAGDIDVDNCCLIPFASTPAPTPHHRAKQHQLAAILIERYSCKLTDFTSPCYLHLNDDSDVNSKFWPPHCAIWPIAYQNRRYGFIAMHCQEEFNLDELKGEFISNVMDDLALAIYSQDTTLKLKSERDFNKEIVDTIQALMVTIRPCGTILSFNKRAEEITGYREQEIIEKYWVDVMVTPENRLQFQKTFSKILQGTQNNINFMAPLLTKSGSQRYISWHGSIRHNIETGQVGLVMLGIDETENLFAGQQLNMFTARWEKIFIAMQDPALLVARDNTIVEANPATFAAAKKSRDEVIGKNVCDILHCGHGDLVQCPLEQLIGLQKTQISETELHGFHGIYMLTVSPLVEENGEVNATLLLARNLTEEEVVRAEAIRVAQLAAIGELASGVAHEINNPINGIINYAQIILDEPEDPEAAESLQNIISEGKRIAGIVSNLLDFARRREEIPTCSDVTKILESSVQLVSHLLKKEGITCTIDIEVGIPPLKCNEQQLQQVVLNIISNARHAVNSRFPEPCKEKKIDISARLLNKKEGDFVRLTFTDTGIGIIPEIRNRLFDPFFSTKPKGEGTGLGLSISHGLIRDHGGIIRVQSKPGEWTKFTIDLPITPE